MSSEPTTPPDEHQQAPRPHDERRRPSYAERRQQRFERSVEKWNARLEGPPPPVHWHRAVITLVLMAGMLWLLWLLTFAGR